MDRRYSKKGLTIVAPEVQGSSVEAIQAVIEDGKMEYTVTQSISGPRLGTTIPRMAVFDTTGKLAWVGHPMDKEAERAIKDALKEATPDDSSSGSSLPPKEKDLVELRSWTNAEGNAIEATLISVEGNTGHFKKSNGQKFDYDITKLSADDQEVIKKASEPPATE